MQRLLDFLMKPEKLSQKDIASQVSQPHAAESDLFTGHAGLDQQRQEPCSTTQGCVESSQFTFTSPEWLLRKRARKERSAPRRSPRSLPQ